MFDIQIKYYKKSQFTYIFVIQAVIFAIQEDKCKLPFSNIIIALPR